MTLEDLGLSLEELAAEPLELFAREGVWLILSVALEEEVTEFLGQHLGACLTFYRFPEGHWKSIRTSNVLERALREVRRRTDVIGRFPTETSALMVVFGVLEGERLRWRGVRMDPDNLTAIQEAVKSLDQTPIPITALEKMLAA